MAVQNSASGWMVLVLCAYLSFQEVTSQTAGRSNVTYDIIEGNSTSTLKPAITDTSTRPRPNCSLVSERNVQDTLKKHLESGAKLIELDLTLEDYPAEFLRQRLQGAFTPSLWVRSTGRQGSNLLMLEDNYDFMSLFVLSIGVHEINVTLTDSPRNCLRMLNEEETMAVIRTVILNDFQPQEGGQGGSLGDKHVCNRKVKNVDGYAEFPYVCCRNSHDGNMVCKEVKKDDWMKVILVFIILTKVLVILYSPSFLPETVYRFKFAAKDFVCLPKAKIKMVVTQYPDSYNDANKVVKLSTLEERKHFTEMCNGMKRETIYKFTPTHIWLKVKFGKLLGENYVPVGIWDILVRNFLRCKITKKDTFKKCCSADILGKLNPGVVPISFRKVLQTIAIMAAMSVVITPWIIRVWIYFVFEDSKLKAKEKAANDSGLKASFYGSLTQYLTPLHIAFIIIYVILALDSLLYGVVAEAVKNKIRLVATSCMVDTREKSHLNLFKKLTKLLLKPFEKYGLLWLPLFLVCLVIALPLMVILAAFCYLPAVNLTIRLFVHFFLLVCPFKIAKTLKEYLSEVQFKMDRLERQLSNIKVGKEGKWKHLPRTVIIAICLLSFWSATLLLVETASFLIEMVVYVLMGIIVNAGTTLQYVSVGFLTIMYGRSAIYGVSELYVKYHKEVRAHIIGMMNVSEALTTCKETDKTYEGHEKTGMCVLGENNEEISVYVKGGRLKCTTTRVFVFVDSDNNALTPEKFFYETIHPKSFKDTPKSLGTEYKSAFVRFVLILFFLFFVLAVVMAFGDAYSVSTTNQLLATVVGGFVPFLFQNLFPSKSKINVNKDNMQFRVKIDKIMNEFKTSWPVSDTKGTLEEEPPSTENDVDEQRCFDVIIDVSTQDSPKCGHFGDEGERVCVHAECQ